MSQHYDRERIKKDFGYDPTIEKEILDRAEELTGKTINDIIKSSPYPSRAFNLPSKGEIGNVIEECWFGIKNNPSPEPDFVDAGIELKIVPLVRLAAGLTVKERTKICGINYHELVKEQWKSSHARKKLEKILFIYYEYDQARKQRSKVTNIDLWDLRLQEEPIIRHDWEGVREQVAQGYAHQLSESMSKILAACRTGQGGVDAEGRARDLVSQPYNSIPALRRAFALKQSFTKQRWLEFCRRIEYESAAKSLNVPEQLLEFSVLKRLRAFEGMKLGEFAAKFNMKLPNGKNAAATIIKKTIGFKNVNSRIKEFEQAGIEVRIVPVRPKDHMPWEAVSFPAFRFKEFEREDWETSALSDLLDRILFIPIYREDRKTPLQERVIGRAFFWSPSIEQLLKIEKEWRMYKREVKTGKTQTRMIRDREVSYLTKASQTKFIHIRPHGRDRNDRDIDAFGHSIVKQSFWLNKEFVHELILESLKDEGR